jgi:hypothetical protein
MEVGEVEKPLPRAETPTTTLRETKDAVSARKRAISLGIVPIKRMVAMVKRKDASSVKVITWRQNANYRTHVVSAKRKVTWPQTANYRTRVTSANKKVTWPQTANYRTYVTSAERKVTWPQIAKNLTYVASVERKDTEQAIAKLQRPMK